VRACSSMVCIMVTNMDSSSAQTLSAQTLSAQTPLDRNFDYAVGLAFLWGLLVIVASICVFVFDVGWMGTKSDQTILYVAGGIFALASVIGGAILAFIPKNKNSAMPVLAVVFAILLSLNSAVSVLWAGTALSSSAAPAPADSKSKSLPKGRRLPRGLDSYFEISKYIIYAMGGILVASPLLLLVLLQLMR
jgi:hypothetical protein